MADEERRDRLIGVICQLWCWLGPLLVVTWIVRPTAGRRSELLRQVTADVLNLQILVGGFAAACLIAAVVGAKVLAVVALAAFTVVAACGYVVGVVGAVRVWRGEAWRYPLNLHLVQG